MENKLDLKNIKISKEEVRELIDESFIHERKIFPIEIGIKEIKLAMVDIYDSNTIMHLKAKLKKRVLTVKMTEEEFYMLTSKYFGIGSGMFHNMEKDFSSKITEFDLEDKEDSAEIVRFVNQVLLDAYKRGSTDIHFDPIKNDVILRYRIDGVLHLLPIPTAIKNVYSAVVSRIKIMGELDISEKRLPQDGRIKIRVGEKEQDLRISALPTINGESIVIRILANEKGELDMVHLGMEEKTLEKFRELIHKPNGIVLVTGPTGSGKTTTLFSGIKEINDSSKKIITIEDPVEYQLDGVSQMQVKPDIGLTFAEGLRAVLRQDPDIIMVGEIRDKETAEIAIRASLTGHLVFATLHTNDSISSVTRLMDMGIEPYLITSSLIGVLAQRLVRKICPYCKAEKTLDNGEVTYYGKGCDYCFQTGYKGRTSIHELYVINDDNKKDILNGKSNFEIKANLKKNNWQDLYENGILKVKKGMTTYEEILRVAW